MTRGVRPARGGGRWVDVSAERLERFLSGFAERHGGTTIEPLPEVVRLTGVDGAVAECEVPFPPLEVEAAAAYGGLVAHARRDRQVGVVLARRGGHAAGVFRGATLVASKTGSRNVAGRTAAGGWSQQRFARRREGQARVAVEAAADAVAAVLLPQWESLDAVVAGGDRAVCDEVLHDARLAPLLPLLVDRRLDVPDPRQRVLEATPTAFRAVRVRLIDP